jgi:hypothetical protein
MGAAEVDPRAVSSGSGIASMRVQSWTGWADACGTRSRSLGTRWATLRLIVGAGNSNSRRYWSILTSTLAGKEIG